MPDYRAMYHKLFNAITDAINLLQQVQRDTEEIYISTEKTVQEQKDDGDHD